jgi:hypothetical protein
MLQIKPSGISFWRHFLLAIISVPPICASRFYPSVYLAEHTGIPRWVRLSLLSSQCVLFLPPLHVISLAWHVYVYPIIPILIMFLLTSDENFRGIPRHVDRSDVISSFPAIS